ncbi:MAG TPA: hypothetical protein DCW90_09015 [Lachnospiraceae bacterium]|nr:hypothetical protein [Lachnospiraceae bacterium]
MTRIDQTINNILRNMSKDNTEFIFKETKFSGNPINEEELFDFIKDFIPEKIEKLNDIAKHFEAHSFDELSLAVLQLKSIMASNYVLSLHVFHDDEIIQWLNMNNAEIRNVMSAIERRINTIQTENILKFMNDIYDENGGE